MGDLLPIFGVSFMMWLIVHAILYLSSNLYCQLVLGISLGAIVYLIGAKIFLKAEFNDALSMVPDKIMRVK